MSQSLSPALTAILGSLVEERTGLHYGPQDHELFMSKVTACAVDKGFESVLDYYYALRYDDPDHRALDALCEALVVNETYFFREVDQLRVLCDDVLVPAVTRGERPRLWCAASATGEEPLTIAMLLDERNMAGKVDIVASDISAKALARAQKAAYGQRSFRASDAAMIERWFRRDGDRFVASRALVDAVTWHRINIVDSAAVSALGAFDAILCRNVLIYFSEDSIRRAVDLMTSVLRPGGYLLVGASESLLRFGTLLDCEERGGSFFYVKTS